MMRSMQKWNYETHEYDSYLIPVDWKVSLIENDMDTCINCPHCGKETRFGECYTSIEIHNPWGLGFAVCEECYDKEWERRRRYREE